MAAYDCFLTIGFFLQYQCLVLRRLHTSSEIHVKAWNGPLMHHTAGIQRARILHDALL